MLSCSDFVILCKLIQNKRNKKISVAQSFFLQTDIYVLAKMGVSCNQSYKISLELVFTFNLVENFCNL